MKKNQAQLSFLAIWLLNCQYPDQEQRQRGPLFGALTVDAKFLWQCYEDNQLMEFFLAPLWSRWC